MIADALNDLSPILRRIIAVLVLVTVVGVLAATVLGPIGVLIRSDHRWQYTMRAALSDARGMLAARDAVEQALATVETSDLGRQFLASAGRDGGEALRSDLAAAGRAAEVSYERLEPIDPGMEAGLTRFAIRVSARTSIDRLRYWIEALRAQTHALRIVSLKVSAPQQQGANANPPLQVVADVVGYVAPAERP